MIGVDEIVKALGKKGLGGVDVVTGGVVVETAELSEDINGGGGLSVSWRSSEGGVIEAGSTLLGYVMEEPYVPVLQNDGTYSWSPKWSDPCCLLKKNPYSKELTMVKRMSWLASNASSARLCERGEVLCVVGSSSALPSEDVADGALAIVTSSTDGLWRYEDGEWAKSDEAVSEGDMWRSVSGVLAGEPQGAVSGGRLYALLGGEWRQVSFGENSGEELTSLYTHAYAGSVRTIVADMNAFLSVHFPGWKIVVHDDDGGNLCSTYIVCTFDGSTVMEAIEEVANKAAERYSGSGAVNLYYVGKTVHLGISHAYASDSYYNRFIVLGGTKNMASRVPAGNAYAAITQRLHIPEGNYSVGGRSVSVERGSVLDMRPLNARSPMKIVDGKEVVNEKYIAPMTRFLVWDDIYPKLDLCVTEVKARICWLFDETGEKIPCAWNIGGEATDYKKYAKWYIKLSLGSAAYQLDTRYIIQDRPLSLLFQSGPLTGREFEAVYFKETWDGKECEEDDLTADDHVPSDGISEVGGHKPLQGEFRLIIVADGDILLPGLPASFDGSGGLCPRVGDVVTLVNVAIEDQFKERSREDLLERGYRMARLISSGKEAKWEEELRSGDVVTGDKGNVSKLGSVAVGFEEEGYVVTGIETDLLTGKKRYSWGTFKPRGILSSSIDKIGSLSLSGGEASFKPLVSNPAGSVIYVGDGNSYSYGGVSSGSSGSKESGGGVSQVASKTIREAGGNTNVKTVYTRVEQQINEVAGEVGKVSEDALAAEKFGDLARTLWEHRMTLQDMPSDTNDVVSGIYYKWDVVRVVFGGNQPILSDGVYFCNGSSVTYNGSAVTGIDVSDFNEVYSFLGLSGNESKSITCSVTGKVNGRWNLYLKPISYSDNEGGSVDGGIQVWLCYGDEGPWRSILDSTTAAIQNLGNLIRLVVFGSENENIDSAGLLTTKNYLRLFAETIVGDGKNVAEALLGIKYHVNTGTEVVDVKYDGTKWVFTGGGTVRAELVEKIEAYSFAGVSADLISFDGKTIVLAAYETMTFHNTYGSGIDSLVIDGYGKVLLADTSISNAAVNGVLTVEDSRIFLKSFLATPSHQISPYTGLVIRSPQSSSDDIYNYHVIELGMKEFSVSDNVKSSNSFLNLLSFKSDWSTSLGYIRMRCGNGNGTDVYNHSYSEIKMGFGTQDNVYLRGDYERTSSANPNVCNYVAVRGRFAIIPDPDVASTPLDDSTFLYGQGTSGSPKTFTTADGKTVEVIGGIITGIT